MDKRLQELATMPVGRLLLRYSIPAVVGIVVMQLYNIVDRIFIGQVVGTDAIAGLAITFPLTNITTALGVLIGAGASARVSIMLGNKDEASALKVAGNSLVLTLSIGAVYVALFYLFLDDLLVLFGATAANISYARDMMLYVLPGLFLTNIAFSFNNIMRSSGFPARAMVTMFIGAGVNVILDPIFIYLLDWGIKGAAIATDIAMAVSALFVMSHFVKGRGVIRFKRGIYKLDRRIVWGIIGIGAAPCIVNLASCLINILINHTVNRYGGSDAIASVGVFVTLTAFVVAFIIGICQGMQPIVGYNYGAKQFKRLRRAFGLTAGIATAVSLLGWLGGQLLSVPLTKVFITDDELITATARTLSIATSMFWTVGIQIVATTFFQSIGRVEKSIFLSLTRQVLFLIPALLLLPGMYGLKGVWLSFPTSDIAAFVVTIAMILWQFRSMRSERA
ncbi:MAG: MATE family efflux transporter [Bacteroidales bacterium]|nr:MATE family efflux transporter [Bacteroidales bacterium]MBD5257772.1 MATE family efflux transporter [Barnesiella sp.]